MIIDFMKNICMIINLYADMVNVYATNMLLQDTDFQNNDQSCTLYMSMHILAQCLRTHMSMTVVGILKPKTWLCC